MKASSSSMTAVTASDSLLTGVAASSSMVTAVIAFTSKGTAVTAPLVLVTDVTAHGSLMTSLIIRINAVAASSPSRVSSKYLFNSPPLLLNDKYISRVHQHKHLGLWLSANLDWEKQIQTACLKANGKLAVLRSVKFLDRATLDLLYKLTIRSVLEYGLVVYYTSLTQKTAIKTVTSSI